MKSVHGIGSGVKLLLDYNMKYAFVLVALFIIHSVTYAQQDRWTAPAWADTLSNPFNADDEMVLSEGENLYIMLCAACHGEHGNGGGGAGQSFTPPPADFTKDIIQQQTDGALFWKISEGNPPGMLSYKGTLSDSERWQIVSYLRQFAKPNEE